MCDAILFDCDGVLIDSEILVCRIAAEELTELGYPVTTEDVIRRFAGRPDSEMKAEIEAEWGQPLPETYRERVNARTYQAYGSELRIMPGIAEALRELDLPVCVASSSFPEKLELGLRTVGLYDRFAPNVVSATLVPHGKPEPDVFLFAAGWMKTSPMRCLVVEDSVAGVHASKRAGMDVLGFAGGSHCDADHPQRLLDAGASTVFEDMRELPALIKPVGR
ncbi:MAG TPA: HAD family phosphatase [Acidobacteriaceae bacterium]